MGNFCICKNSQSFPQVVVSIFNFLFMGLVMVTSYDVMVVELQCNYGDLFSFCNGRRSYGGNVDVGDQAVAY